MSTWRDAGMRFRGDAFLLIDAIVGGAADPCRAPAAEGEDSGVLRWTPEPGPSGAPSKQPSVRDVVEILNEKLELLRR